MIVSDSEWLRRGPHRLFPSPAPFENEQLIVEISTPPCGLDLEFE